MLNSATDGGHVRIGKTLAVGAMTGGLSLLFGGSRTAKTITLTFKTDQPAPQPVLEAPKGSIGIFGWVLPFFVALIVLGALSRS